jgi:hypothetical protein
MRITDSLASATAVGNIQSPEVKPVAEAIS